MGSKPDSLNECLAVSHALETLVDTHDLHHDDRRTLAAELGRMAKSVVGEGKSEANRPNLTGLKAKLTFDEASGKIRSIVFEKEPPTGIIFEK